MSSSATKEFTSFDIFKAEATRIIKLASKAKYLILGSNRNEAVITCPNFLNLSPAYVKNEIKALWRLWHPDKVFGKCRQFLTASNQDKINGVATEVSTVLSVVLNSEVDLVNKYIRARGPDDIENILYSRRRAYFYIAYKEKVKQRESYNVALTIKSSKGD